MNCRKYKVTGLVQGVFYRANTETVAKSFHLKGWVRNAEDGTVECVACGDVQQLEDFEKWLWQGPSAARVTRVEVNEIPVENYSDFNIVY